MFKVSLNMLFLCVAMVGFAQKNPHGTMSFKDCTLCHSTADWSFTTSSFSHDTTGFVLTGQHRYVKCADCHTNLVFSATQANCTSCHADMHSGTLGFECKRCHQTDSWIVPNTSELHEQSRFPLLGTHKVADCASCHTSASNLVFEPLGAECIDCHRSDYQATTNPNHLQTGLSTNCIDCHKIDAFEWSAAGINHDFLPLTNGHDLNDCASCHSNNLTEPLSADCYSCHQNDYLSAATPSHQNLGFETNCAQCHTTDPDWKPAEFKEHDLLFPIYSGEHKGEWNSCADCHTQPEPYGLYNCINCHEHNRTDMDKGHGGVSGYTYGSPSCFACHPTGDSETVFDHSATAFPLTGSHKWTACIDCHASGYAGTSTLCSSCHLSEYNYTNNPNHAFLGMSKQCIECHGTGPGWAPALFPDHDSRYTFRGAHAAISTDCYLCHQGNYARTSSACFSCHSGEYNSTTNPNHIAAQYSTNCISCHTESAWEPSTFDHDATGFALTGAHVMASCNECHTVTTSYSMFSCVVCHEHNKVDMDEKHRSEPDYMYQSTHCLSCHPNGKIN